LTLLERRFNLIENAFYLARPFRLSQHGIDRTMVLSEEAQELLDDPERGRDTGLHALCIQ
jgi:hypothetical protein